MLNKIKYLINLIITSQRSFDLKPWIICISAFCFFFYEFMQLNILNAISDHLVKEFSLSSIKLGNLSSTYFITDVIFLIPAGIILDRISVRKVIIFSMAVSIISALLFSLSKNYWMLCISHSIAGFSNAFCFLSCTILIKQWFSEHQHSLLIGILVVFGMLGGIVAQLPMEVVSNLYGWRSAVLLNCGVGIIIFIIIYYNVFDKHQRIRYYNIVKYPNVHSWKKLSYTLLNKSNWFLGLYAGFMELPVTVFCTTWGKIFLSQVYFVNSNITEIISMLLYGTMLGAPSLGWYVDKFPKNSKLIMMSSSLVSIGLLVILLHFNKFISIGELYLIFFGIGYFTSIRIVVFPLIMVINHPSLRAQSLGFVSVLILVNAALVHPLIGILVDLVSIKRADVFKFIPIIMFFGVVLLIYTKGISFINQIKDNNKPEVC